tara:strand:- start:442 stop:939 length:498 start_codon:yes stop_codon:yes gene_type:complete
MKGENTKKALDRFGKYLVKESRKNLTRKKKNVTNSLYESLDYDLKVMPNSFEFDFLMNEYGEWVDKGRKAGKNPPFSPIREWVQNRKIQFRSNKGKFQTYDQTAWAIVGGIGKKGIPASNFYSRPFKLGYAKLPDQIVEAYALDVEQFLDFTIDKLNKEYKDGSN